VTSAPRTLAVLSGYAVEGGLDGPYQPATAFSPRIALGHVAAPGEALDLWAHYETLLDAAADAGLAGLRLDVSWARLEPRRGERDEGALARYASVVHHARARGLWVTLGLVDAAWPAWLGLEAWLMPWVAPVVVDYAAWVLSAVTPDAVVLFVDPATYVDSYRHENLVAPWRRRADADAADVAQNLRRWRDAARERVADVPWVTSWANVFGEDDAPSDVDEIHVHALVGGRGPLASRDGMFETSAGEWRVATPALVARCSR